MDIAHPKNERDSAPSLYLSDTRGRAGTIVKWFVGRLVYGVLRHFQRYVSVYWWRKPEYPDKITDLS
jgi:hypothetical protein